MSPDTRKLNEKSPSQDLTLVVQDLIEQMNTKFTKMGNSIMGKMSEMNSRMDELEQSITELMNQAGLEAERKPSSSTKSGRSLNLDNSII